MSSGLTNTTVFQCELPVTIVKYNQSLCFVYLDDGIVVMKRIVDFIRTVAVFFQNFTVPNVTLF